MKENICASLFFYTTDTKQEIKCSMAQTYTAEQVIAKFAKHSFGSDIEECSDPDSVQAGQMRILPRRGIHSKTSKLPIVILYLQKKCMLHLYIFFTSSFIHIFTTSTIISWCSCYNVLFVQCLTARAVVTLCHHDFVLYGLHFLYMHVYVTLSLLGTRVGLKLFAFGSAAVIMHFSLLGIKTEPIMPTLSVTDLQFWCLTYLHYKVILLFYIWWGG